MTSPYNALSKQFWASPSADTLRPIQEFSTSNPKNRHAILLYYKTAMHLDRYDDAQQALTLLHSAVPQDPHCVIWTVELDLAQGRTQAAREKIQGPVTPADMPPEALCKWVLLCIQTEHTAGVEQALPYVDALPDGFAKFQTAAKAADFSDDLEAAIPLYRKALSFKPKNAALILRLAKIAETQHSQDEAIAILQDALTRAPNLKPVRNRLLSMRIQQDPRAVHPDEIDDFIQGALSKSHAFNEALKWAAMTGDPDHANRVLDRMDQVWPDRAKLERAELALAQGNPKLAVELSAQAPKDPNLKSRHYQLRSKALRATGQVALLYDMIKTLLVDPVPAENLMIAAQALSHTQDKKTVARLAGLARQESPDIAEAWRIETRSLALIGLGHKALAAFDQLPPHLSRNRQLLECKYLAARAVGEFDIAKDSLSIAAEDGPGPMRFLQAKFLTYTGAFDDARTALADWVPSAQSDQALKHCALGNLGLGRFDTAEAMDQFDQAIALNPNLDMAFAGRARANLWWLEPQQALADLNQESRLRLLTGSKQRRPRDGLIGQLTNELLLATDTAEAARAVLTTNDAPDQLLQVYSSAEGNTPLALATLVAMRRHGRIGIGMETGVPLGRDGIAPSRIPPKIFQYWEGDSPTPEMTAAMDKLATLNPWAAYHRFDASSAKAYVRAHASPTVNRAYSLARQPAERADLLRLVVLLREGGIWVDADDICRGDLAGIIPDEASLVLHQEGLGSAGNNFIATAPASPILQEVLEGATQSFLGGSWEHVWLRCGPGAMTRALVGAMAKTGQARIPDGVCLLPEFTLLQRLAMACPFAYKQTSAHWENNDPRNKLVRSNLSKILERLEASQANTAR